MSTHPLWKPFELADLDEVAKVRVGAPPRHSIEVVPYDPAWPAAYDALAGRVRGALGDRVLTLQHVGSTSVPGLAAKPVLDVDLVVADTEDEAAYLPDLEAAGFVLRIREPEWEGHRLLTTPGLDVNLHVFPPHAVEPARHRLFRDFLRTHPEAREAYAAHKSEVAARGFRDGMDYNNHKAALVYDLYEQAFAADPEHEHTPQPRA